MSQLEVDHDSYFGDNHSEHNYEQIDPQCIVDDKFIVHPDRHQDHTYNHSPAGGNIAVHDEALINAKPLGKQFIYHGYRPP